MFTFYFADPWQLWAGSLSGRAEDRNVKNERTKKVGLATRNQTESKLVWCQNVKRLQKSVDYAPTAGGIVPEYRTVRAVLPIHERPTRTFSFENLSQKS